MSDAEQEVRVLVVDDSQDAADSLAAVLSSAHYAALAAYDGQSALVIAANFRPHIVLLDLDMPRMNGFATAAGLRKLEFDVPLLLIAYTAHTDMHSVAATSTAGFDLHVDKPCEVQVLLKLLEQTLSARRHAGKPLQIESVTMKPRLA
ncbi:MAG: response regulator [Mycobacterium sp.]